MSKETLKQEYNNITQNKSIISKFFNTVPVVNSRGVFANNKCDLQYIKAFGFDCMFCNFQSNNCKIINIY